MPIVLRGSLVHTPRYGGIECLEDHVVAIQDGYIIDISPGAEEGFILAKHGHASAEVVRLQNTQFLLPGLVDTHVHASQYPFTGTATNTPLMQWLDEYTFPTEASFARDAAFATAAYTALINRLLSLGTTTALYFATLHIEPCKLLVDLLDSRCQRALVGKVAMDRNGPMEYLESTDASVASAEEFIRYVRAKGSRLLHPVVTPRFVPTCTPGLLERLGALAKQHGARVQSHISESYDAVAFVQQLHPEAGGRDAAIFDAAGLLTDGAVMAHGVLLNEQELRLFAERGVALAHCPLSNMYFADRVLRVNQLLAQGVKVGLGTDVAGGYDPSMLSAIRHAVVASRALHIQNIERAAVPAEAALHFQQHGDPDVLSWRQGLWLATMGGAQALGLQAEIGSFQAGKQLDALLVDGAPASRGGGSAYDLFPSDSLEDQVEKFINLGDDRHIRRVWVAGCAVAGTDLACSGGGRA